jgi:hypothetical protein
MAKVSNVVQQEKKTKKLRVCFRTPKLKGHVGGGGSWSSHFGSFRCFRDKCWKVNWNQTTTQNRMTKKERKKRKSVLVLSESDY